MMTVEVNGAARIAAVAALVRHLGDGRTIPNEMAKEIRRAVPPARKAVKARALEILPHSGGLNVWVSRGTVRAQVRRSVRSAGVKIVDGRNSARGRSDFKRIDAGAVRAPAWGNRKKWHVQQVAAGFFNAAVKGEPLDTFVEAVEDAIANAERKLGL